MQIGSNYSKNKVYRGIRHYDKLPLLSEDIHEYADTVYMKNAYIMNNIIGHGVLNTPDISSGESVLLSEPYVLLLDGDVSLIQADDYQPILDSDEAYGAGYASGVFCIVGWYQEILWDTALRNYGGVRNSIIDTMFEENYVQNELADNNFGVQVSSRYQFRWMPLLLNKEKFDSGDLEFDIEIRDKHGELPSNVQYSHISTIERLGDIFKAKSPTDMDYVVDSTLYIAPLFDYEYSTATHTISASNRLPTTPKGSAGFITSESVPLGEYIEGTTWYNPITKEFKTYVAGEGFISRTSTMGFIQYQSMHVMEEDVATSTDIVIDINISDFQIGDILQVAYEGLLLIPEEQYTINYENRQVTLLSFTADAGDKVSFTTTRVVEANDITNMTSTLVQHMRTKGASNVEGHVKLSDTADTSMDSSQGVAATPKAVYEASLITSNDGTTYKFGVMDGLLYLEEV